MSHRGSLLVLALTACALFAAAPAASAAALTSSNIDSPEPGLLRYDDTTGPTTMHVTGTADPPGSHVDLRCRSPVYGSADLGPASLDVPTDNTTGDFAADVTAPLGYVCRLRAVEAGQPTPSDVSHLTGPAIEVSGLQSFGVETGSNAGKAADYYIASMLPSAGNDFASIGTCGLNGSFVFDSSLAVVQGASVFDCAAWTPDVSARAGEASLEVDGHPSYGPATIHRGRFDFFPAFEDRQPYPDLTYSYNIDPVTHNLTIHETDHFVTCKPTAATFPPTATSCTAFADAGVKLDRTIVADHGQELVRFIDRWSSTNGHSHLFTIRYENDHCLPKINACADHAGFRLPGEGAYTVPADGTARNGPFQAPGTIFVKDTSGNPGSVEGGTTYSVAPDSAYFRRYSPSFVSGYTLDYLDRSVPAHGSLDFRFAYSTAPTTAAVTGLAQPVEDSYAPPRVTIANPIDGDSTAAASVRVRGSATDNVGVSSFTLNGQPMTLGPGGAFSHRVQLAAGKNTFTALARDEAGNTGRARATLLELLARTHKARAKRRGRAVVVDSGQALVCPPGPRGCTAKLAAAGTPGRLGTATVKAKAGKSRELAFKLNRKGRTALRHHKHLKINLKIDIRYGRATHVKTSRTFTVQRP